MATDILGFLQKMGPWQPFKEGTPHLVKLFATTFFKPPITWAENELLGHFLGSKQSSGRWLSKILNFDPWQLFKEGGLKWTFKTLSVLKMIVLVLAI